MKKIFAALLVLTFLTTPISGLYARAVSPERMMIYEVYTSGGYSSGKSNMLYKYCYVVLYNGGQGQVDLSGWSIKAASGLSAEVTSARLFQGRFSQAAFS